MAELDFDELDKAVNDLMVNVDTSKRTDGLDDPVDTVVTIPSSGTDESATLPVDLAVPQASTESNDALQSNVSTPKDAPATPPLAVKRRGHFMDIVHPSLNMTSQSKFANQHGTTIKPSSSTESSVADNANKVSQVAPNAQADSTVQSGWKDHADTVNNIGAVEQTEDTGAALANGPDASASASTESDSTEPAPLSSPFLSDMKVEKRPLGGLAPRLDIQPEAGVDSGEGALDAQVPAKAVTPEVVVKALPEELSVDVMAVESNDLSSHPDATKILAPSAQVAAVSASETKTLSSNGSISQQYTEQPSSGDQTNGSIYDTATYHQVLDADKPKKKSSPLKWIIWIVVLLLVGAAAGAAYYFATR